MDASNINPFITSVTSTLPQVGFGEVKRIGISQKPIPVNDQYVTVNVDIKGDLIGYVKLNMSEDSARTVASKMMMGMEVSQLDDMSKSAISELTNMIAGQAAIALSELGKTTDIDPPVIFLESSKLPNGALHVEFNVDSIPIELEIKFR